MGDPPLSLLPGFCHGCRTGPEADPTCDGGTAWRASDGNCYNGLAVNVDFDLSGANAVLPNDVIVAVAYSTQSYGSAPLGVDGPYNSLNVGLDEGQTASVGSDADADSVFWNTTYPGYTAGLKSDSGWAPYGTLNLKVTASAPPTPKDLCKNGGWASATNPSFRNQGECVSYFAKK